MCITSRKSSPEEKRYCIKFYKLIYARHSIFIRQNRSKYPTLLTEDGDLIQRRREEAGLGRFWRQVSRTGMDTKKCGMVARGYFMYVSELYTKSAVSLPHK